MRHSSFMDFQSIKNALPQTALREIGNLPFPRIGSGKVREIYDLGDRLLIVATDRLSAFDVILPDGIPGKGILLTQISLWWFRQTDSVIENHLVPDHDRVVGELLADHPELILRSMIVRKLKPLPLEAVVRGYLAGSGWKEYQRTGQLWGQLLPKGLKESSELPEPLFTPTTKAAAGHDLPVTLERAAEIVGAKVYEQVHRASLALYRLGAERARKAGLLLADTKFEFGQDEQGKLYLIDEILTPDSSRYWPADGYEPGHPQPAFDKQYVRDYLETLNWDKTPPGPQLPSGVIAQTQAKYLAALERLME